MSDAISNINLESLLTEIKQGTGKVPYLNPRNAITWFYNDHPLGEGRIHTVLLSSDPVIFRAEIYIHTDMVASAHANAEGNTTTLKKIESAAIRRALANAGYGSDQIVALIAKTIPVDKAKEMLGSGKNRRMGDDKPRHWALNGGGERVNEIIKTTGLKWDDIKTKIEPGKTLLRLSDTTLTEEQVTARLNVLVNERDNPSHQSSAQPTTND